MAPTTTQINTLSLHDALPISPSITMVAPRALVCSTFTFGVPTGITIVAGTPSARAWRATRSEEHTSELQSRPHLVCRLLLEKIKIEAHASAQTLPAIVNAPVM